MFSLASFMRFLLFSCLISPSLLSCPFFYSPVYPVSVSFSNLFLSFTSCFSALKRSLIFLASNAVGVRHEDAAAVKRSLDSPDILISSRKDVFDGVAAIVQKDLVMDSFPRFLASDFYKKYIRTKPFERSVITIEDFTVLRVLGRGAFGMVNAAKKNNTGQLYAIKCVHKKHALLSGSIKNILLERDVLAEVESRFVVKLHYAVQDRRFLYFVLDLMMGGDLEFHLKNEKNRRFNEERTRFYAAEILLGLEHIHAKNII